MIIEIRRLRKNRLYTESELHINDRKTTYAVESTADMLPVGIYSLQIVKQSARKQKLCIFGDNHINLDWTIGVSLSWIGSKKNKVIAIGEPFFPGAVNKASAEFERIIDRITKGLERNEHIQFVISEDRCQPNEPIKYWLEDKMHGCPPSNRRVEVDEEGIAYVYDGDVLVKTIYPKEEKALPVTRSSSVTSTSINHKP